MNTHKPNGYNALSPYFLVDDADALLDQLEQIFTTKRLRRYNHDDGKIMHAELMIEDSVIMISSARKEFPAHTLMLHVYVPNVDLTFKKAMDAGCEKIDEPVKKSDPDKRGSFYDLAGNYWSVATQID